MNKTRLEAFSDGVLAIIITIMVLEIHIPAGTNWEAVRSLWPTLGSYVLSFVFIGIYWGNHHHLVHTVVHVNAKILWANLHLLFWLSLVPVATAWMGTNGYEPVTVAVYGTLLVCCGIAFTILSKAIAASRGPKVVHSAVFQQMSRKAMFSSLFYLASIPLAFVNPLISCGLFAAVSLMWIVPNKDIEKLMTPEVHS